MINGALASRKRCLGVLSDTHIGGGANSRKDVQVRFHAVPFRLLVDRMVLEAAGDMIAHIGISRIGGDVG